MVSATARITQSLAEVVGLQERGALQGEELDCGKQRLIALRQPGGSSDRLDDLVRVLRRVESDENVDGMPSELRAGLFRPVQSACRHEDSADHHGVGIGHESRQKVLQAGRQLVPAADFDPLLDGLCSQGGVGVDQVAVERRKDRLEHAQLAAMPTADPAQWPKQAPYHFRSSVRITLLGDEGRERADRGQWVDRCCDLDGVQHVPGCGADRRVSVDLFECPHGRRGSCNHLERRSQRSLEVIH